MFSSATLVVWWGLLPSETTMAQEKGYGDWGLVRDMSFQIFPFDSALCLSSQYSPPLKELGKKQTCGTTQAGKTLVSDFSSPATRPMKKLVSPCLVVWFMPGSTAAWVQTDTGKSSLMGAKVWPRHEVYAVHQPHKHLEILCARKMNEGC